MDRVVAAVYRGQSAARGSVWIHSLAPLIAVAAAKCAMGEPVVLLGRVLVKTVHSFVEGLVSIFRQTPSIVALVEKPVFRKKLAARGCAAPQGKPIVKASVWISTTTHGSAVAASIRVWGKLASKVTANPVKMTPLVLGFSRATPIGNVVFVVLRVAGFRQHKEQRLTFKFLRCKWTLNNMCTLREVGGEKAVLVSQLTKEELQQTSLSPSWIRWGG